MLAVFAHKNGGLPFGWLSISLGGGISIHAHMGFLGGTSVSWLLKGN